MNGKLSQQLRLLFPPFRHRINAADIEKLCDDWVEAATNPTGGFALGADTEKHRLLANGVQFHDLSYDALCASLIGLSKVLLLPGLNTVVVQDHYGLWSWCGELILGANAQQFPNEQRDIRSLYEVSIHAALALCNKPAITREDFQEQARLRTLQPHHAQQLVFQSSLALSYLAFPLLEAVLKRACADYVDFDGRVIAAFSVPTKQGNNIRQYDATGPFRDRQCSSLRDLLFLYRDIVASPNQRALVEHFRVHLTSLDSTLDPFDLLYRWRNQSLHGNTSFQTIGGTVLNLALLISIFELEVNFEQRRKEADRHCRWEAQSGFKSPWSYYPPY